MEIPVNLVYIENDIITNSNENFKNVIISLYPEYDENSHLRNKNIQEVFVFQDEDVNRSRYTLIKLGQYRLYTKTTIINNIIVINCSINEFIDSRYFIHTTLTPLSNIIELMRMLDKTSMTHKQREYTSIIKKNNFELTKNINDITNYLNYLTKGTTVTNEIIKIKTKLESVIHLLHVIDKIPINNNLHDYDVIISDNSLFFDLLYYLLFILKKETSKAIDVSYDNTQKSLKFKSEDFLGYQLDLIKNYNFSTYKYNDTLDIPILKLVTKLSQTRLEYNHSEYYLTFV